MSQALFILVNLVQVVVPILGHADKVSKIRIVCVSYLCLLYFETQLRPNDTTPIVQLPKIL